ncbi:O-antigen ligase [Afifella sp. IM 167]|uniref:O-antigen ligase family protein n=1 Tax=Afifella sp. IM 167 TaxID=2033586 RepID=UPI001CCA9F51|nr:O-antigen ligase family protein [Afifella sp. IM 167]
MAQDLTLSPVRLSLAATAVAGLAFLSIMSANALLGEPTAGWIAHVLLLGLLALAIARPWEGYLLAVALCSVGLNIAIPHGITSAPSSYLIMGSFAGLLLRGRLFRGQPIEVLALAGLLAVSGLVAVIAGILSKTDISWKLPVAEYIGILSMTAFLFVPIALVEKPGQVVMIGRAILAGILVYLAGAAAGSVTTLGCFPPSYELTTLSGPGMRLSGMSADPNVFAVAGASFIPFVLFSLVQPRTKSYLSVLLLVGISAAVIASGSRSGIAIAGLAASASLGVALLLRSRSAIVLGTLCLAIVAAAPSMLWRDLPCPLNRPLEMPTFTERNDGDAYFRRLLGDEGSKGVYRNPYQDLQFRKKDDPLVAEHTLPLVKEMSDIISSLPIDDARRRLWLHAFLLGIESFPIGYGLGTMPFLTPMGWRAHNTALTVFAEMGVPGLLCLGLIGFVILRSARDIFVRFRRTPIFVFSAATCVSVVSIAVAALAQDFMRLELFWALLGLLICVSSLLRRDERFGASGAPAPVRPQERQAKEVGSGSKPEVRGPCHGRDPGGDEPPKSRLPN